MTLGFKCLFEWSDSSAPVSDISEHTSNAGRRKCLVSSLTV